MKAVSDYYRYDEHTNYDIVSLVIDALRSIEGYMHLTYRNKKHKDLMSPFDNHGNSYSNKTFSVHAFEWDEEAEYQPNFQYKNLKVDWYKYLGRDTVVECDVQVTPQYLFDMLVDCFKSLDVESYENTEL